MLSIVPLVFLPLCAQADLEFSPFPFYVAPALEKSLSDIGKYAPGTIIDPGVPSVPYSAFVDKNVKRDWLLNDKMRDAMLKGTASGGG